MQHTHGNSFMVRNTVVHRCLLFHSFVTQVVELFLKKFSNRKKTQWAITFISENEEQRNKAKEFLHGKRYEKKKLKCQNAKIDANWAPQEVISF